MLAITNECGSINYSEEALANIVGVSTMECYGVVGMASRKISDGITELLGRENIGKGVEVKITDDTLTVDLYIIVQYGTKIHEVANNVMEKVDFVLRNTLGFNPDKINVIVHGVRTK